MVGGDQWVLSWLGNRRWVKVAAHDAQWRVVVSFPFNPRGLPDFFLLNPLGGALLAIGADAALWLFRYFPWRSVAVYKVLPRRESSWGECYALNRRVALAEVDRTVEQMVAQIRVPGWPDGDEVVRLRASFRVREAFWGAMLCVILLATICAAYPKPLLIALGVTLTFIAAASAAFPQRAVRQQFPQHVPAMCVMMCSLLAALALLLQRAPAPH